MSVMLIRAAHGWASGRPETATSSRFTVGEQFSSLHIYQLYDEKRGALGGPEPLFSFPVSLLVDTPRLTELTTFINFMLEHGPWAGDGQLPVSLLVGVPYVLDSHILEVYDGDGPYTGVDVNLAITRFTVGWYSAVRMSDTFLSRNVGFSRFDQKTLG